MPAHIKSSMFGCSLTYAASMDSSNSHWIPTLIKPVTILYFLCSIPITDGRLNMGTWQVGIVNKPPASHIIYPILVWFSSHHERFSLDVGAWPDTCSQLRCCPLLCFIFLPEPWTQTWSLPNSLFSAMIDDSQFLFYLMEPWTRPVPYV